MRIHPVMPSATWLAIGAVGIVLTATATLWAIDRRAPISPSAETLWRWRLKTRVTARGAAVAGRRRGDCARCGDERGRHHECRDIAR